MKRESIILFCISLFCYLYNFSQSQIGLERKMHKQEFLNEFAFNKEILFLEDGYIYYEGDTVFFRLLPCMKLARLSIILDFDSIWVKTSKGESYGYSRHINYLGSKEKIVPIIDTISGRKNMQGWKYLNNDEYFFPILEKVFKNGKCCFPFDPVISSHLGISKDQAQKFFDNPLHFPDSLSDKMQKTLKWYNPILFNKLKSIGKYGLK